MAIIYVDRLDTTLVEPLDAESTQMVVSPEAAGAIRAAFGWPMGSEWYGEYSYGPKLMRLPLYIDNGVAVERVEATFATDIAIPGGDSGDVMIVRGTPSYAFGAGSAVRCAPPAGRIAEGFEAERSVTGATCIAVPGETVAWAPDGGTLQLAISDKAHAGDCWPARVVIANAGLARTVGLMDIDFLYGREAYLTGLSGDGYPVSSISLPEGCKLAVLTVRRSSHHFDQLFGYPLRTLVVEVFG